MLIPLGFPYRSQVFSQLGLFSHELMPLRLLGLDALLQPLGVRSRAQVGQSSERLAQIGAAALPLIALEYAHTAQVRRQLVDQHLQGLALLAGDQNSLAISEERSDQVADRVGLSGAWGALDYHAGVVLQPLQHVQLGRIGDHGEQRFRAQRRRDGAVAAPPGGALLGFEVVEQLR
ncbi:hypothetical protein AMK10_23945 [Streptomyces sp. CB02058]|nr:hypothetical protein AMK10_23945 [Streptomyces sp. CB02058]